MSRLFRREHADPTVLKDRTTVVVGYGNQGRAQALNLRDSGVFVRIGNRDDEYADAARDDGFEVLPIADAVAAADVVLLLIPDEIIPEVFAAAVQPALRPRATIVFASGYCVAYGTVQLSVAADVVLLAPRMIGAGVRDRYRSGEGFYSFVAVHQDSTGQAWPTLLALADGIGSLSKGALEVTFPMEAELDLFNEQAFGPAFGKVLLSAMKTLLDAGYPKEAVFLEIFLSGELSYICRDMAETGLISQLDHHSQTSQYGAMSRGVQFLRVNLARPMRRVLKGIRTGKFAKEWSFEQRTGKLRYRFLLAMAHRLPMGKVEQSVRKALGLS